MNCGCELCLGIRNSKCIGKTKTARRCPIDICCLEVAGDRVVVPKSKVVGSVVTEGNVLRECAAKDEVIFSKMIIVV